jgi:hypothetical protein
MTEQLGEIMREVVKLGNLAEINEAAFRAVLRMYLNVGLLVVAETGAASLLKYQPCSKLSAHNEATNQGDYQPTMRLFLKLETGPPSMQF